MDVQIAGNTYSIAELTVGAIRAWLADAGHVQANSEHPAEDIVGHLLLDGFTDRDLAAWSGIPLDVLRSDMVRPSELAALRDALQEVNPLFFGFLERMSALAASATAQPSA